jgi:hypothetical protein
MQIEIAGMQIRGAVTILLYFWGPNDKSSRHLVGLNDEPPRFNGSGSC